MTSDKEAEKGKYPDVKPVRVFQAEQIKSVSFLVNLCSLTSSPHTGAFCLLGRETRCQRKHLVLSFTHMINVQHQHFLVTNKDVTPQLQETKRVALPCLSFSFIYRQRNVEKSFSVER